MGALCVCATEKSGVCMSVYVSVWQREVSCVYECVPVCVRERWAGCVCMCLCVREMCVCVWER